MLIGIDARLNADILHALSSMGHGDELVICDSNFPATRVAASTIIDRPVQMGVDALTALRLVLTVFPIDTFDLQIPPIRGMAIVGKPDEIPEIVSEAQTLLAGVGASVSLIERHAFYDAARKSFVVIRTTETRPYGNFILRKGVV